MHFLFLKDFIALRKQQPPCLLMETQETCAHMVITVRMEALNLFHVIWGHLCLPHRPLSAGPARLDGTVWMGLAYHVHKVRVIFSVSYTPHRCLLTVYVLNG